MQTVLASSRRRVVISPDGPFVVVGERINPTGRRVLTAEMARGVMDRARADAVAQARAGAQVLDVNAGIPGTDEPALLAAAMRAVMQVTDVPLCIDSARIDALEAGLRAYEGKALVNSVSADDDRMERILPMVKKHGAAVIGMVIDANGIPKLPAARIELARRIVERAADHGIPAEDVIIDPVAEPAGAAITLETIRLVREQLGCNAICGASNVSFGLPDRPAANAEFLPQAIRAGLTCAIANPFQPHVKLLLRK